jgi:hypothetical protein
MGIPAQVVELQDSKEVHDFSPFRAIKGSNTSTPSGIPPCVRNDIPRFVILKGSENERLASLAVEIR